MHEALSFESRFFSLCRGKDNNAESISFSDSVDPLGDLRKIDLPGLKHLEENEVCYLRRVEDDDGSVRFVVHLSEPPPSIALC